MLKDFFSYAFIMKARKLLAFSGVSLSYAKGKPQDPYQVVSGIIKEDRALEARFTFKNREPEAKSLKSQCNCTEWTEQNHCSHVAALYIYFQLQAGPAQVGAGQHSLNNLPFGAVTPEEYGTLIERPQHLVGAPPRSTYAGLQYQLRNQKLIHFPVPKEWQGKLVLNFAGAFSSVEGIGHDFFSELRFKHKLGETLHESISLLEQMYLFNWEDGQVYHLSSELKNFIQKLRIYKTDYSLNDIISLIHFLKVEDQVEITLKETPLAALTQVDPHPIIVLQKRKGSRAAIRMEISFGIGSKAYPLPALFKAMAFENGYLNSFTRKKDAYEFLYKLNESLSLGINQHSQALLNSDRRRSIAHVVESLIETKETFLYDQDENALCRYDNLIIAKLFQSLVQNLGELAFRFSSFEKRPDRLQLEISEAQLSQGFANFYQQMIPYGTEIYYDKRAISTWGHQIRFERKQTSRDWFNLQFQITNEDLEIIQSADLDSGLALTQQGMILLTSEQKELLRFMKRYTQWEGKETGHDSNESENGENPELHEFALAFSRVRMFELFELKRLGVAGEVTQEEEMLFKQLSKLQELPQYPIPESLENTLRPYQRTGYHWLRFLFEHKLGACLADDMGLGKTLQAISFLKSVYHQVNKVLITCPVSLILNWQSEIEKFSDLKAHIYHGGDRKIPSDAKIILTSYGVMKREVHSTFSNMEFDIFILDEIQHLKNIRSQGAFAARQIKASFHVGMTGTPVENDLSEFYNILDLCIPGLWGDTSELRLTSSTLDRSRLMARKVASPFILRRTKAQVLTDLPAKLENNVFLDFSKEERARYIRHLLLTKERIQSSTQQRKYGEILKGLLELRQNCLWQRKDLKESYNIQNIDSTKVEFLIETLDQILEEGHQVIIYSQFTTYLDIIQNAISERHWKQVRIDGSQSIKKRQEQVNIFQKGEAPIFLISLKAGGVGLNLTAASYVFIMDPWWNPAVESQAIDRAHRIGQTNVLTVYRPIIKETVEEKVLELQAMKRQLFQELLPDDEEGLFTGKLTMKDFEHLFST